MKIMQLRQYQQQAVDAVYNYLRRYDDNPCVVIPTAGGKTPILATIVKDAIQQWDGRVMILSHVKELLEQAVDKIHAVYPECDIGIYSTGLKRWDTDNKCIVAGIQSAYRNTDGFGKFDLIIVDEAHLIPEKGDGMYRNFLRRMKDHNPELRVIGLTATPYRLTSGPICAPDNILNKICFEVGVKELLQQGFLCPLRSKASRQEIDASGLHVRAGEFIESEVDKLMNTGDLVAQACSEIISYARERKAVIIFCCSIDHAQNVLAHIRKHDSTAEAVFGDTLPSFRAEILERFKAGKIKFLINVGVLTTGFDAPNIDCVVLLRPTASPGLYYQMVGRGFRLHPDKKDCLVLDFGGNIERHGPVDSIQVEPKTDREEPLGKTCPQCREVVPTAAMLCHVCGHSFIKEKAESEEREIGHDAAPAKVAILSGEITDTEYAVQSVRYSVHEKRNAEPGAPRTMKIEYRINMLQSFSEWICPEHGGYVKQKFIRWWRKHAPGCDLPHDAQDAVWLATEGALEWPTHITVRTVSGEKYPKIIGCRYPEKQQDLPSLDEIPF